MGTKGKEGGGLDGKQGGVRGVIPLLNTLCLWMCPLMFSRLLTMENST